MCIGRWVLAKEKIEESLKRMPKCEEMHDYKRECEENQLKKEVEVKRELKVELKELLSYADNKVLLDKAHAKALEVLRAQPTDPEAYHLYCQVAFRQGDIDLALPNGTYITRPYHMVLVARTHQVSLQPRCARSLPQIMKRIKNSLRK